MKHNHKKKILGRKASPRKALMRGMATSLILYEKIETTEAKAKVLKPFVEKLITKGKRNDLTARRALIAALYTENAVKKVLEVLSPRYLTRPGGYARIIKTGYRQGDAGRSVRMELV